MSPGSTSSYTIKVSQTWLPKHEVNRNNIHDKMARRKTRQRTKNTESRQIVFPGWEHTVCLCQYKVVTNRAY